MINFAITGDVAFNIVRKNSLVEEGKCYQNYILESDDQLDIISTKKFLMIAEKLFENDKISLNSEWKTLKKIFNKKNLSRKECLLLPIRALLKIIKQRNV